MSMSKQEVVEAFRVLMSIIETKFKPEEIVYESQMHGSGKGSYTAAEVVGHANIAVKEFEESEEDVAEPAKEICDLWSRLIELTSSKCPSLHLARAPGDRNLYLDVTDRWTGEDKLMYYAPSLSEVIVKASDARRRVIKKADSDGKNLR